MPSLTLMFFYILVAIVWLVCLNGFFTLQPNEASVLIFFGKYVGTVRTSGFHWVNPLTLRRKISLRQRNLNTPTIKVNDLGGNPIEIAAVLVWSVLDTTKAVFDVENYQKFVEVQAEAALRHLAMAYPYDSFSDHESISLRGNPEEVAKALVTEVQERIANAGCVINEGRLAHLAYAPEIASAMLQRQQADAIVAARSRIVEGSVGMVEMAIERLSQNGKLTLDDERRASMATNLMVVLCAHEGVRPVVNAGTLYH
jgi:regulator of protease activity HflC (stomatin/prohibitin superfamily)